MNWPVNPGQKIRGVKAAIVVAVEDRDGVKHSLRG